MFTQGTYVDETGTLRDAGGGDTGFAVEDDGRIISTDGANDTGGAYIDATGQVFYGDNTPMQGVSVTIGGWPGGGQLQTIPLLDKYVGEADTAANFGAPTLRGTLAPESEQWTTEYDAAETDSVRPRSVENGLLVDETGSPMTGTFGYVLDPNGQLFTFSTDEMWVKQEGEWIDLATLGDIQLAIAALKAVVDLGEEVKAVHHSTAVAGGPVAGAGQIKVQNGLITELDDSSGHYQPQADQLLQTLEWLRQQGMPVDQINLKDLNQEKLAQDIYNEWLAQQPPPVVAGYVEEED
jgi:hypothetical protein